MAKRIVTIGNKNDESDMVSHHSKFSAALSYQRPAMSAYLDFQSNGLETMSAHEQKSVGFGKKARANVRVRQLHSRMIMHPKQSEEIKKLRPEL